MNRSPKPLTLLLSIVLTGTLAVPTCVGLEPIELWPGPAPGEKGDLGQEHDTTQADGGLIAGQRVVRLANVARPTITFFRPPAEHDTGAAVVVCPGGGYHILALDLEGTEVCEWLNSIGVTGVLLKYRVPRREGLDKHTAPLQDAQRAIGIVRRRASEFGLDPHRIGVLGFSAGGHLAAAVSTDYQERAYPKVDASDEASCRPDFTVLVYPGYLTLGEEKDRVAPELVLTDATPPTFLVMSQDDPVGVENVLVYTRALQQVGVPTELHIYPSGGHGYGLRPTYHLVTTWPDRASDWMRSQGWLDRRR